MCGAARGAVPLQHAAVAGRRAAAAVGAAAPLVHRQRAGPAALLRARRLHRQQAGAHHRRGQSPPRPRHLGLP